MIAIGFICLFLALFLIMGIGFKSNNVVCGYLAFAIFVLTILGTLILKASVIPR